MNLEEKAQKYVLAKIWKNTPTNSAFKAGYKECKADLLEFLKANPKADNKQIKEYLNSL